MPWFKSPDGLANSKGVMSIPRRNRCAAMGLWLLAGTWCSKELTDGFVPAHMIAELASTKASAAHLVTAGFWTEVPGGYQFLDWSPDQPTRAEVEAKRAEARSRMKRARGANKGAGSDVVHANNTGTNGERSRERIPTEIGVTDSTEARSSLDQGSFAPRTNPFPDTVPESNSQVDGNSGVDVRVNMARSSPNPDPTRPDPYIGGHLGEGRPVGDAPASGDEAPPKYHPGHADARVPDCDECDATAATFIAWKAERASAIRASAGDLGVRPADRCHKHLGNPKPPQCGPCGDARRIAEAWDTERKGRLRDLGDARRAGIDACAERRAAAGLPRMCDAEGGWRIPPPELEALDPPVVRCDHFDPLPASWRALIANVINSTATEE
ncbi:hypothetical protein AB0L97_32825 [Nocardia sp. NPDC051911]|uniref:hypothetical protein n=1 Tax=Nocardia sp. NPDC051911 TaxID=3154648 RepID=UPI00341C2260